MTQKPSSYDLNNTLPKFLWSQLFVVAIKSAYKHSGIQDQSSKWCLLTGDVAQNQLGMVLGRGSQMWSWEHLEK